MNARKMKCVIFVIPLGGSGSHTGHHALYDKLSIMAEVLQIKPKRNILTRSIGKGFGILKNYGFRDHSLTAGEFLFDLARRRRNSVGHLSAVEFHFPYLHSKSRRDHRLCGTIHFPINLWQEKNLTALQRLGSAICLWTREFEQFEKYVGKGRVRFIHHGVDTEFFHPNVESCRDGEPRVLVAGQFLRNFEMLRRVVKQLVKSHPLLRFDFLIPVAARNQECLLDLVGLPQIQWHAGLSESQLMEQYRKSYIHLLPMNESGANNAVVESLASGLPVVTTDVGGIRDYGGGTIFPIVANNDDDAMIALVEQYLANPAWRNEIGAKCRRFAEDVLAWPVVAQEHIQAYRQLAT